MIKNPEGNFRVFIVRFASLLSDQQIRIARQQVLIRQPDLDVMGSAYVSGVIDVEDRIGDADDDRAHQLAGRVVHGLQSAASGTCLAES